MNIFIISQLFLISVIIAGLGLSSLSAMNRQIFLSSKKSFSEAKKSQEEIWKNKIDIWLRVIESKYEVEELRRQQLIELQEERELSVEESEELNQLNEIVFFKSADIDKISYLLKELRVKLLQLHKEICECIFDYAERETNYSLIDEEFLKDLLNEKFTPDSLKVLQDQLSSVFGIKWWEALNNQLGEYLKNYQQLQEEILILDENLREKMKVKLQQFEENGVWQKLIEEDSNWAVFY